MPGKPSIKQWGTMGAAEYFRGRGAQLAQPATEDHAVGRALVRYPTQSRYPKLMSTVLTTWLLVIFFGVMTLSYVAVGKAGPVALRFKHVAMPNERSSHLAPIPYGGGLVLVVINIVGWLVFVELHPGLRWGQVLSFVAGGLLIAGVSFLDDVRSVPFPVRLALHVVAAGTFVVGWGPWNSIVLPVLGEVNLGSLGAPLTVLWVVGLTNAFNFIDGIDGLAAGQAVVAGLGWALLGALTQQPVIAVTGIMLGASSLGFLAHNWQPASIFLGDSGATFLGYSFGALAVVGSRYDIRLALCGILLVWPAVFDTGFTVLRRIRNHQSIFAGHRTFLFHRLVDSGWSHATTSALYIVLPICGAGLAFVWEYGNRFLHVCAALALCLLCLSLWLTVRHRERPLLTSNDSANTSKLELVSKATEAQTTSSGSDAQQV